MIDWLVHPVPDFWAAVGLAIVALVCFVWATSLITLAYDLCGQRSLPRWHPARWLPPCFSFWLGWMLMGIAIITGYLGFLVLTGDGGAPLWGVTLCVATGICGVMAFRYWAQERLPA